MAYFQAVQAKEEEGFWDALGDIAGGVISTAAKVGGTALAAANPLAGAAIAAGGSMLGDIIAGEDATTAVASGAINATSTGVQGYMQWKQKQDEWDALYNMVGGDRAKRKKELEASKTKNSLFSSGAVASAKITEGLGGSVK